MLYMSTKVVVFFPACGEVTERPKVHDWKSCVPQGTEGSNPSFSAINSTLQSGFADRSDSRVLRNGRPPTPSDPGGSSGNGLSRVPRGSLAVTCVGNPFCPTDRIPIYTEILALHVLPGTGSQVSAPEF